MLAPHESTLGAYDAKTHFSELLERVESGEEITITRHGSPVARMVPVRRGPSREQRRASIEALRALAKGRRLGNVRLRDLVERGRR